MRLTEKQKYDIIHNINTKFLKREINSTDALNQLKDNFPRTKFVLCTDTGKFHRQLDATLSLPSGNWYASKRNFHYVRFKTTESSYCHEDDAKTIGFLCDYSFQYFNNQEYTQVNCEGELVCKDYCVDNDIIELVDGEWFYKKEESGIDDTGRADYHSTRRLNKNQKGMGVELEIFCDGEMYDFCAIARKNNILTEYDGSLDDECGVELIGKVLTFEDYQKMKDWGKVFEVFSKYKCIGHDAGTKYGMHVSLSLSLFSELELSKFVLFMNSCSKLCKVVAQRQTFYNGKYGVHDKHKKFKKTQTGKYEAVRVDDVRAEVRIFRSTTRQDRFLKNIEFCEAVRQATKEMTAQEVLKETSATDLFLLFVNKHRKTYPNLYTFLVEEKMLKPRIVPEKYIKK